MKKLNTTNIVSLLLLIPIVVGSVIMLLGYYLQQSNIIISIIAISSITISILNIFNKTVIEKKVDVIVEKKIYIEKEAEEKSFDNKTQDKEKVMKIISKPEKNFNTGKYINKEISKIAKHFNLDQIVFYIKNDNQKFTIVGKYAFITENEIEFVKGEGLSGQVVKDEKSLYLTDIPDGYITIISGLGKGNPKSLLIVPVFSENEVIGIVEYASLNDIEDVDRKNIEMLSNEIAINLINVK